MIWVLWITWWRTKHADRENYHLCDKHGAIRDKDMLTMVDDGNGPPIKMCPVCYTERIKEAYAKATTSAKV